MTDVNVPSYIIDRNGVVAWLNPAAESIVGDVRGHRFTEVVTPGDRPRAKEAFARKIVGKEKVTDAEVDLVGADGREVSVEVSSVPLKERRRSSECSGSSRVRRRRPSRRGRTQAHAAPARGSRPARPRLLDTPDCGAPPPEQGDGPKSRPRRPPRARRPLPRGSRGNRPRRGSYHRLTQLGHAPSRAGRHHLAAVRNEALPCGRRASNAGDPHPLVCGSPSPGGVLAAGRPRRGIHLVDRRQRLVRLGHDPDVGAGDSQPSGYVSRASSSETEPAMITSSPCCQLAGVATLCLRRQLERVDHAQHLVEVAAGRHRINEDQLDRLVRRDHENVADRLVVGGRAVPGSPSTSAGSIPYAFDTSKPASAMIG